MSDQAPKEDGIILLEPAKTSNNTQQKTNSLDYLELPVPKNRKSKLTGRVGQAASLKRSSAAAINDILNPKKKKPNLDNVIEEHVDIFNDDCYDIPMHHSDFITIEDNNDCRDILEDSSSMKDIISIKDDDDDCCIAMHEDPSQPTLTDAEVEAVRGNQMLSDQSINICQTLLKQQCKLRGLEDSIVCMHGTPKVVPPGEHFVQILHCGSEHWVCVANIQSNMCRNVYLYNNSLCHGTVTQEIARQVAKFIRCKESWFFVYVRCNNREMEWTVGSFPEKSIACLQTYNVGKEVGL